MINTFNNPYIYGQYVGYDGEVIINNSFSKALEEIKSLLAFDNIEDNYIVSIDQSTKCTGISINAEVSGTTIIFDIVPINKGAMVNLIQRVLYMVSELKGKVECIIIESPLKHLGGWARTSTHSEVVLDELYKNIKQSLKVIPSLTKTNIIKVPSNVWKSFVVDKTKGKRRVNSKREVSKDILDIEPLFYEIFEECSISFNSDYDFDMFDALGMLLYYKGNRGVYTYVEEIIQNKDYGHSITGGKSSKGYVVVRPILEDSNYEDTLNEFKLEYGLSGKLIQKLLLENNVSIISNCKMSNKVRDIACSVVDTNSENGLTARLLYGGKLPDEIISFLIVFIKNTVEIPVGIEKISMSELNKVISVN